MLIHIITSIDTQKICADFVYVQQLSGATLHGKTVGMRRMGWWEGELSVYRVEHLTHSSLPQNKKGQRSLYVQQSAV